jgi:6-phosphofructokinase 1
MTKRVAILTGGGDVPGLNMCLKSLTYRLIDLGYEPIGIRKGWEGLLQYNPDDPSTYSQHFIELTKSIVRAIDRTPGSILHSSRLDPRSTPAEQIPPFLRSENEGQQDLTPHIQNVIQRLGYRALIVLGDDDMLQYTTHLSQLGIPVVAIPKTIHNNIPGTDYTLGFSTGLGRGVAFIHELRALAGSREQIVVIETFAAKSGYSTLLMALLAGSDRVVIPEVPYNPEHLARLLSLDKIQTPANYAVLIVCDGARPQAEYQQKYRSLLEGGGESSVSSSGLTAAALLRHLSSDEIFHQDLTYLLRTGAPDGQDLLGAVNFAFTAATLVDQGVYGRMAAFKQNTMWTHISLSEAGKGVKTVDVDRWYDRENYQPRLDLIWSVENV